MCTVSPIYQCLHSLKSRPIFCSQCVVFWPDLRVYLAQELQSSCGEICRRFLVLQRTYARDLNRLNSAE
jgi:hypothetical protein